MNLYVLLAFLLLNLANCKTHPTKIESLSQRFESVNPDYGILPKKYKQRSSLRPLLWRCFPLGDVKIDYRYWRDIDPLGPSDKIVGLCDFKISVTTQTSSHVYIGRRAKPQQYCKDFKTAWNNLTRSQEHICLDGETLTNGEPELDAQTQQMMTVWVWDKIATKNGCYSFWTGSVCADF